MSKHLKLELEDGEYPLLKEIKGACFRISFWLSATDISFQQGRERENEAAHIVKCVNNYDEMLTALKLVLSQSCHALPPHVFEEINRVVKKVEQ